MRRARPSAGFTLLELLLVMTIIAILAGTVVVGFGNVGSSQRVRAEAERLALAVEMARSEALRRNALWGLSVDENGYDFKEYDYPEGKWESVARRPFSSHAADEGVEFAVQVRTEGLLFGDLANLASGRSDEEAELAASEFAEEEEEEALDIDIAILPGGEITPFDVAVTGEDAAPWAVRSDGIQAVRALAASDVPAMDAELKRLARRF